MTTTSLSSINWQSQVRVLLAIARKDYLHLVRYPLNALFRVLQPFTFMTPIYFLGQSFKGAQGNVGFAGYAGTTDYMSYVVVGYLLSSYIFSVFWMIGYSLKWDMDSGVLESNWLTPTSRFALLVGRTFSDLVITTLMNGILLLLAWSLFGFSISGNLGWALLVAVPMLLALYGFGFAFAAIILVMRDANTMVDVSHYLISLLSGDQFPVRVLPAWLLPLSLMIPLTYGFDAVRGLLLQTVTLLPIRYEIAILVLFMVIMLPTGYWVFKVVERRCKRLGTLGMH